MKHTTISKKQTSIPAYNGLILTDYPHIIITSFASETYTSLSGSVAAVRRPCDGRMLVVIQCVYIVVPSSSQVALFCVQLHAAFLEEQEKKITSAFTRFT